MENKQMDKRHQRTNDKSNQKTTNGVKKNTKDQHKPIADTHGSKAGSDWDSKNQPGSGRYDHDKPGSEAYQGQYSEKGSTDTRSDHQSRDTQTRKDQGKWEGQERSYPTGEKSFNTSREDQFNQNPSRTRDTEPNRYRDTESAGVIDEDRGLFENEEMNHPSRERYQGESIDTENSSIDSPKKKNQAPPSKFS